MHSHKVQRSRLLNLHDDWITKVWSLPAVRQRVKTTPIAIMNITIIIITIIIIIIITFYYASRIYPQPPRLR
jgi:hypothetical protein